MARRFSWSAPSPGEAGADGKNHDANQPLDAAPRNPPAGARNPLLSLTGKVNVIRHAQVASIAPAARARYGSQKCVISKAWDREDLGSQGLGEV